MVSLSKGMSAGDASSYFSKDDYYTAGGSSAWIGTGAETLGLAGQVEKADFAAVAAGLDPASLEVLVPAKPGTGGREERRAGNDMTFSAPKSVSILHAAGVEDVKTAHDAAVLAVAAYLERELINARTPTGRESGSLVAAKFDHETSRAGDPQLHSHLFIVNSTQTGDGRWRATEPSALYKEQKKLGFLYRNELARGLQALGYGIEITDRKNLLFEVAGVSKEVLQAFSTRSDEVQATLEKWENSGKYSTLTRAERIDKAVLASRDAKVPRSAAEVFAGWQATAAGVGSSLSEIAAGVTREAPQAPQQGQTADQIAKSVTSYITEQEAVFNKTAALQAAAVLSGGAHSLDALEKALSGHTLEQYRDKTHRQHLTTPEMKGLEQRNLEGAKILAGTQFDSVTSRQEVADFLGKLEREEGIRLEAGQAAHVVGELTGSASLAVTQGDPGTGKTFANLIIERFNREVLQPSGRAHFSINSAYTGKAAAELGEAAGKAGFTVHSLLAQAEAGKLELPTGGGAQVVLRVDEASFLGARQAEKLMDVVQKMQAGGVAVKLQLLGDTKQLQAISAGDFFRQAQTVAAAAGSSLELKKIVRQKVSDLREVATLLNRGDGEAGANAVAALEKLSDAGRVFESPDKATLAAAVVEKVMSEVQSIPGDPQTAAQQVFVVTATNKDKNSLNIQIRNELKNARYLDSEEQRTFPALQSKTTGLSADTFTPGDQIIFNPNVHGVQNGGGWQVQSINAEKNSICIVSTHEKGGELRHITKTFGADFITQNSQVFEKSEREISLNEKIIFLKNDKNLGVKNGETGTVAAITDKGFLVTGAGGKTIQVDTKSYPYFDYGYAGTVHKSQGATVHSCILHHDGQGSLDTSYNSFNVAATRATHDFTVFTTDAESLKTEILSVDEKTTTINPEMLPVLAEPEREEISRNEGQAELSQEKTSSDQPDLKEQQQENLSAAELEF